MLDAKRFIATCAALGLLIALAVGCDSLLEEDVYSELSPDGFLTDEAGLESALVGAYGSGQHLDFPGMWYFFLLSELPTDILTEERGVLEQAARPLMDFTWDPSHPTFSATWNRLYEAIRNANLVLDNVDNVETSEETRALFQAEARFVRAKAYVDLYSLFCPVPLITSSDLENLERARATDEEMRSFIEEELRAAASGLPLEHPNYGRATKGAALGVLTKFLLNTRQWEEAAAAAREVIGLGRYSLVEDRVALFDPLNERNPEFIYVTPALAQPGLGNVAFPHIVPDNYPYEFPPKEAFGADFKLPDTFVDSFLPEDERRGMILTEYINTSGELVQLGPDNARPMKYQEDPGSTNRYAGNDIPEVRYADILLSLAEALNETQGPAGEALDLLNEVRAVANTPPLSPSDAPSSASFRDALLAERGREFFVEGKRREDLIRMDRFIENAQARGKSAQPHHVCYPIPQAEVDANSNIEQNPGY
jgi:hypothetical protein